jgi:hypothetical protein
MEPDAKSKDVIFFIPLETILQSVPIQTTNFSCLFFLFAIYIICIIIDGWSGSHRQK